MWAVVHGRGGAHGAAVACAVDARASGRAGLWRRPHPHIQNLTCLAPFQAGSLTDDSKWRGSHMNRFKQFSRTVTLSHITHL